MEEDAATPNWAKRAACRWVTYSVLWSLAVCAGLASAYHPVMRIVAGLLGCIVVVAMPILFATLFEITYLRREKSDMPVMCFPWLGSAVLACGFLALLQASSFLVNIVSSVQVDSVRELSDRFASTDRELLPRSVCIKKAFVKTEWEAGKLRCEGVDGHVHCAPAFVAAPIFDDKILSEAGLPEQIYAWAVTQGTHVDANYRQDGSLCGYLSGRMELEYHISDYRLAVTRVIQKQVLSLNQFVANAAENGQTALPLEARPLLLTADPLEVSHVEQAWLMLALVLLCCCPCAGPLPVAGFLGFACWSRRSRYGQVETDDYDDEYAGHAPPAQSAQQFRGGPATSGVPWGGPRSGYGR